MKQISILIFITAFVLATAAEDTAEKEQLHAPFVGGHRHLQGAASKSTNSLVAEASPKATHDNLNEVNARVDALMQRQREKLEHQFPKHGHPASCENKHISRKQKKSVGVGSEPVSPPLSGIELGNASSTVKIDGFMSPTCGRCKRHWEKIVTKILEKYADKISFVLHPLALPFQPNSYDGTLALFAFYEISGHQPMAVRVYLSTIYEGIDMLEDGTFDLSQHDVWKQMFCAWAEMYAMNYGTTSDKMFKAMLGEDTNAAYYAVEAADFARQRFIPQAPTYLLNGWSPPAEDLDAWDLKKWEEWIISALQ